MIKSCIGNCIPKNSRAISPFISSHKPKFCSNYLTNRSQLGLTMVELLTTITIGALVMSIAVPSFSGMIENNRVTSQTNEFISAMVLARTEAIKRKANINVISIDSTNTSNEWGYGWAVAIDGGATLRVFSELAGGVKLNSTAGIGSFQYSSNGRVNVSDSLTLCPPESGSNGRSISVSKTGRVSTSNIVCS